MKKTFWAAMLIGSLLFMGVIVAAQEATPQPTAPQMQGMSSMMGMMGQRGQMGQMGQMGSMMQMMQGMTQMMDVCNQMMGNTSSSSQEPKK